MKIFPVYSTFGLSIDDAQLSVLYLRSVDASTAAVAVGSRSRLPLRSREWLSKLRLNLRGSSGDCG